MTLAASRKLSRLHEPADLSLEAWQRQRFSCVAKSSARREGAEHGTDIPFFFDTVDLGDGWLAMSPERVSAANESKGILRSILFNKLAVA
jgi:hypothetical protein